MDQSELTGKIIGCALKVTWFTSETESSECIPKASDSLKNK